MAFKFKRSGNEDYYTNSLILLIKNMLRDKIYCQKASDHLRKCLMERCMVGPWPDLRRIPSAGLGSYQGVVYSQPVARR